MLKRVLILAVVAVLLVPVAVQGQLSGCPPARSLSSYAHETLTISDTAKGLTAATYLAGGVTPIAALVVLETDSIRSWDDGTVPTSTVGVLTVANASSPPSFWLFGRSIEKFRAIRVTTDATLTVLYYR